jgi:hypothetical protein
MWRRARESLRLARWLSIAPLLSGCPGSSKGTADAAPPASPAPIELDAAPSASSAPSASTSAEPVASAPEPPARACPKEMVAVGKGARAFCIDRWEAVLLDQTSGERISPHYPLDRKVAIKLAAEWEEKRATMGDEAARAMPLPPLPGWQRERDPVPKAVSMPAQTPNGYVSGKYARAACENAGKRLCTHDEWMSACRGSAGRQFPYGDAYKQGACNVFRASHPALTLHGNASVGHLDPRLLLVKDKDGPLLRRTGETKSCASAWGDEAIYDMVGNLDEWVDDPGGKFVGGFFSRSKRDGCESVITAHPAGYFDYSLGVRCCRDR